MNKQKNGKESLEIHPNIKGMQMIQMASVEKIIIPVKMFSHLRGKKCIIMPKYVFKRY